jgi:flavin reductase (DIM6/NTAB) family NADH-FMN oxidoreductase RutF
MTGEIMTTTTRPTAGVLAYPEEMTDASGFHDVMSRFATCVTVVTAYNAGRPAGCTATAVFSLTDRPPTMVVSLTTSGGTLRNLRAAGVFAVNVLSWRQRELYRQCAGPDPALVLHRRQQRRLAE